jgi:hypothetical protein
MNERLQIRPRLKFNANEQTGNLIGPAVPGHADISTTANIYTLTSSQSERGAAVAIERAIFGDLF